MICKKIPTCIFTVVEVDDIGDDGDDDQLRQVEKSNRLVKADETKCHVKNFHGRPILDRYQTATFFDRNLFFYTGSPAHQP